MSLDELFRPGDGPRAPGSAPRPVLLQVRGLQLQTHREHVFGPLDWQVQTGQLGVIAGQQGSGRTSVLLALGGRMRGVTGAVVIDDGHGTPFDGVQNQRELMRRTAVARIGEMADIERLLTVAECVDERSVTEGLRRKDGRQRFHALKQELGVDIDDETLVEELSAPMRALVTAILACLRPSDLVLYDDLDSSLTPAQLTWMAEQLQVLGALGHTFVVTVLNTAAMPGDAVILDLDALARQDDPVLPPVRRDHGFLRSAFRNQNPDEPAPRPTDPATGPRHATPADLSDGVTTGRALPTQDDAAAAPMGFRSAQPAEQRVDETRIEPLPHRPAHLLADDDGVPAEEIQ